MTFTSSEQLKCRLHNCASVSGEKSSSTSPPISSRRVLLLYACSGRRRAPEGLGDNLYSRYDFDAQCTQPFEPILFLRLQLYLADFPCLHRSIN
jgi:hypothetical protein